MNDVSLFWIAFGAYLAAMCLLIMAVIRRGGEGLARAGRALVWAGLLAQTVSIVWRSFLIGTEPLHMFFERLSRSFSAGPAWQATVYVLLFAVAGLATLVGVLFRRHRPVWLLTAGVAVVLEMILLDFLDFTRMPIEKSYEYLLIASWCSALALLAVSPVVRLVAIDATLASAASLLTVFAAIQPKSIELQLVPALQSYWLFIHVSLTSIGYAIFGVAFAVAALFLVRHFDRSALEPAAKRRVLLTGLAAKGAAAALILVLVLAGIVLPFRQVAYAPHELAAPPESLRVGAIQVVRYGAAILGAFGTAAYVFFWLLYPFLRQKSDRSGIGSFVFLCSSVAIFAACLVLGGAVQRQERAITRLNEERQELAQLMRDKLPAGGELTRKAMDDDIARWRALAAQARGILSQARWLPLTLERQAALKDDPAFQSLEALYRTTGAEWRLPIRYKDIKQIGQQLGRRADLSEAVAARLTFPTDRPALERVDGSLRDEAQSRETHALLPRGAAGMLAAFVGLALLIATPIGWGLYFLLPLLRDRLPEERRLDTISYTAIAIGYPIFTFGAIFAGAIWAHFAWGNWWSWDPKEVGSLIAWVLYTIYLHQRYREGLSPRTAAVAGMLGFLAATLSLAGNAFLGGLHAYS